MNYKYSDRITRILGYSKEEALRLNNDYIGPEHIMLGMIRDGESDALTSIKSKLCIDMDGIKHEIEDSLRKEESLKTSTDIALDQKSTTIMRLAVLEARLMRSEESDVEHVLLAMMKHNNNMVARIFRERHVTYKDMYDCFNSQKAPAHPKDNVEFDDEEDEDTLPPSSGFGPSSNSFRQSTPTAKAGKPANTDTPAIDKFGYDLTKAAAEGALDPVVGRDREIERLAQILSRRKKNNPVLIGEPLALQ